MLFGQNRDQLRLIYLESWRKAQADKALEPLEQQIVEVIRLHPEYHPLLQDEEKSLSREWLPEMGETNPFLHMGMHLGIREQLATQRPAGIVPVYQNLLQALGDTHEVEHQMMECLAEAMWVAQRDGVPPDEQAYLRCLQARMPGGGGGDR